MIIRIMYILCCGKAIYFIENINSSMLHQINLVLHTAHMHNYLLLPMINFTSLKIKL